MSADTQAPESAGQPIDSNSTSESPATESPATASVSAESAAPAAAPSTAPSAVPSAAPAATPAATPAAAGVEESDHRPSERIQIGTQREADAADAAEAKPLTPGTSTPAEPEPTKSSYPPPNVRDQLSPELEKELEAALGGESLDAIIEDSASAAGAADELQPDTKVTGTVAKIHREDVFIEIGGRNQGLLPLKQFEKSAPPEVGSQLEVTVARFNPEQGLYEVSLPTAAVSIGNWDEVELGQIIDVSITGHNKGGLECQVSGIRGFIPMGQISIYRVENAEEYVGQKLTCVITEANRAKKNLVLSHRALMERERKEQRAKLLEELAPGQIREGTVRSLQDFGAFVDLGGIDGLIHVSQLSWERVNHPRDVLK
ncbi:MAG: S1 RNA-binding domain-containing protein, partial [Bythopirellula sp.]